MINVIKNPSIPTVNESLFSLKGGLILISSLSLALLFYKPFSSELNTQSSISDSNTMANSTPKPMATNVIAGTKSTNDISTLVSDALAFKALLTTTQQSTLQQTFTNTLAQKWSNLPCGSSCRNGIQFSSLTAAQLTAAKKVIYDAAGMTSTEGYSEFMQIITADSLLGTIAGSSYSKGIYFISFLNTPSTTSAWMLQYGGHHIAVNIAFNGGTVVGCTPMFEGVEPITWTNGLAAGPLDNEKTAMQNMLSALSSSELSSALLSSTFSDVSLGPNQDGNFPTTKVGIAVSALNSSQQALVLAAMQPWLEDADASTQAALNSLYESELNDTYIAYTGAGTSGDASSFLTANTNYVRIDGPSVWIELVCQSGVVLSGVHYHSVWRDHTRDYGNYLANTSLTGTIGVTSIDKSNNISIYPNPTNDNIQIDLPDNITEAILLVTDMTGRIVLNKNNCSGQNFSLNVASLPKGNYIVNIKDNAHFYSSKFVKI